jgi:hypothetical protein
MGLFDLFRSVKAGNICSDTQGILREQFGIEMSDSFIVMNFESYNSRPPSALFLAIACASYGMKDVLEGKTEYQRTLYGLRWLSIAEYFKKNNPDSGTHSDTLGECIKHFLELSADDLVGMRAELEDRLSKLPAQ